LEITVLIWDRFEIYHGKLVRRGISLAVFKLEHCIANLKRPVRQVSPKSDCPASSTSETPVDANRGGHDFRP
jgi:hypothetical protein